MAVEIIAKVIGSGWFKAATDDDVLKASAYKTEDLVKITIAGAKKARAYRELCCYKGSCKYIANMNFSEYMNTPKRVDYMTKLRCDFVEDYIHDPKDGTIHPIVRSLSYESCDQPESHGFIAKALEKHSELVGIPTDDYVRLLDEQK